MAFPTVRTLFCSADGGGLLILSLVKGFHDGLGAVLLSGWRQISHSFSHQWLSRRFVCHIAQRMAAHCAFFRSLTAFPTFRVPYCSVVGSSLLIAPLLNGFSNGLRAVLLSR